MEQFFGVVNFVVNVGCNIQFTMHSGSKLYYLLFKLLLIHADFVYGAFIFLLTVQWDMFVSLCCRAMWTANSDSRPNSWLCIFYIVFYFLGLVFILTMVSSVLAFTVLVLLCTLCYQRNRRNPYSDLEESGGEANVQRVTRRKSGASSSHSSLWVNTAVAEIYENRRNSRIPRPILKDDVNQINFWKYSEAHFDHRDSIYWQPAFS